MQTRVVNGWEVPCHPTGGRTFATEESRWRFLRDVLWEAGTALKPSEKGLFSAIMDVYAVACSEANECRQIRERRCGQGVLFRGAPYA